MYVSVQSVDVISQVLYRIVYGRNCFLEIIFASLFFGDHLFPVPLIHIHGVEVVELFIAPYGVHVGIYAVSRLYSVFSQSHSLPFGQRLHYFDFEFIYVFKCEVDSSFHTVQVIVESSIGVYEQRSRNSPQVEAVSQLLLEIVFDFLDSSLTFHQVYQRIVVFR